MNKNYNFEFKIQKKSLKIFYVTESFAVLLTIVRLFLKYNTFAMNFTIFYLVSGLRTWVVAYGYLKIKKSRDPFYGI